MDATEDQRNGPDAIDHGRLAYTVKDAARLLSMSPRQVRARIRDGRLPSIRFGRLVRVHGDVILEYIREHSTADLTDREAS